MHRKSSKDILYHGLMYEDGRIHLCGKYDLATGTPNSMTERLEKEDDW